MTVTKDVNVYKQTALSLAEYFGRNAAERDRKGGNPKAERDLIRDSGLLTLLIPEEYGGTGGTWRDVLDVVHIFAKADSSLAHVYGYHFINLITPHLCGTPEQKEYFYSQTARHNLFWGNAFNPLDKRLKAVKEDGAYILRGVKSFCSGSADSDYLLISADLEGREEPFLAVIPTNRIGINLQYDWDNFGQRQTDSGTILFDEVAVKEEEVLPYGTNRNEFTRLRVNIANFILNHVHLGIMEGAFEQALHYTKTETRPRSPLHESAAEDPNIQRHYGEFAVQLEAAHLLVVKSDRLFQKLWDKGTATTPEDRRELDRITNIAKVFTTKAGLDLTTRIFEVMGSRATSNRYGFDRYWRNLRTMTLHVPVDAAVQEIGKDILAD